MADPSGVVQIKKMRRMENLVRERPNAVPGRPSYLLGRLLAMLDGLEMMAIQRTGVGASGGVSGVGGGEQAVEARAAVEQAQPVAGGGEVEGVSQGAAGEVLEALVV